MFEGLHIPPADGWEKDSQWEEDEGEDVELEEKEFFGLAETWVADKIEELENGATERI